MQSLFTGVIIFGRMLTESETQIFKKRFETGNGIYVSDSEVELCEYNDVLDDITDWLKSHKNSVKEGSIVSYYGDEDGCFRYEKGDWCFHSSDPICMFGDAELVEELKYRGYNVYLRGDTT